MSKFEVFQINPAKDPDRLVARDAISWSYLSNGRETITKAWEAGIYHRVATVEAFDLEHVFAIMNLWRPEDEARVRREQPLHSLSVGDIVVVNGLAAHVVASFGFELLEKEVA